MSDKTPLCSGQSYRGYILVSIFADGESRVVVLSMKAGQAVRFFECKGMSEARALVDAALAKEAADRLPVNGGAPYTVVVDGPIIPV